MDSLRMNLSLLASKKNPIGMDWLNRKLDLELYKSENNGRNTIEIQLRHQWEKCTKDSDGVESTKKKIISPWCSYDPIVAPDVNILAFPRSSEIFISSILSKVQDLLPHEKKSVAAAVSKYFVKMMSESRRCGSSGGVSFCLVFNLVVVEMEVSKEDYSMEIRKMISQESALSAVEEGTAAVDDDKDVCAVCLEDLYAGDRIVSKMLPCRHCFHNWCILPWFYEQNSCPYCRSEVLLLYTIFSIKSLVVESPRSGPRCIETGQGKIQKQDQESVCVRI